MGGIIYFRINYCSIIIPLSLSHFCFDDGFWRIVSVSFEANLFKPPSLYIYSFNSSKRSNNYYYILISYSGWPSHHHFHSFQIISVPYIFYYFLFFKIHTTIDKKTTTSKWYRMTDVNGIFQIYIYFEPKSELYKKKRLLLYFCFWIAFTLTR